MQRCPSVKSLKTELPSFLKCAVMLTVKCQEQTRHVVSEPKNCVEGGGQREIFGFEFTAQWHIYLAQVAFALKAGGYKVLLMFRITFFANVNHVCYFI